MAKVDPTFANEIKKYGAPDFSGCYSCGNCTAICGMTDENGNFPRMMIRYGMLGLKEEILSSKELWLCYACGECSKTCPRQAFPGEYMAALRRYAIASYEPSGLSKLIFRSNSFFIFLISLLSVFLAFFLLTIKPDETVSRWIFTYLPYEVIHAIGIVIFSITGFSMIWGAVTMVRKLRKAEPSGKLNFKAITAAAKEAATVSRYGHCDEEEDGFLKDKSFFQQPRFIHLSVMWGFIGLLAATTLDFIFKDPSLTVWWPGRILGTIAGLFMVYGTSMAIFYRKNKVTETYSRTRMADWVFLWFLWIAGITGFWLEVAVAFSAESFFNHLIFLIHTIISMELVLLFSFSKFAHALYRPIALYFFSNRGK
ncbi:MAG: 4Fe-4S dicluster domain-containing protein [Syntrophothermus sp.]